ncbi:DUF1014-domain-containing protein [Conidiobolus coronatus NRRL 28638]|uniref:DUF1014-domain-containing protein n=1 Tax=Conidiobolus coronatus (strain ATCC 28846 / CBS 209.66 / NRRL 28638) TaxID=796925 RepID=A0A137P2X9_CONC2|nr:DUF1014-domain-containing protein [Conidiobolus coronatus NRRL 28638]|eukprot:KXN69387.1 DUF1014-domain-containing protein [Conidiobolus coronatus NRRL 28638]
MARFKGENTKVTAAKEKKAAVKAEKEAKVRAKKEAEEDVYWSQGAKKPGKAEKDAAKRAEQLAKKAELDRLKKEEEAEMAKIKPKKPLKLKGEEKVAAKKSAAIEAISQSSQPIEEFSASNIDDALDMLSVVMSDKMTISKNDQIDRHPERRAKAAFAAYEARELPILRKENPGLRLTQVKEILWKQWQKSEENPFNQASIAYNATQKDIKDLQDTKKQDVENRLRTN